MSALTYIFKNNNSYKEGKIINFMLAQFDEQDYFLYLDTKRDELGLLKERKLEANLIRPWGGGDWGENIDFRGRRS